MSTVLAGNGTQDLTEELRAKSVLPAETAQTNRRPASVSQAQPIEDRLSFENLREYAEAERNKGRAQHTPPTHLYDAFRKILPSVDIVSFDIFDTALVRYVEHPVDVFFHLAQHPAFQAHHFAKPVSRLRIDAENSARRMVFGILGSMEVNLLEIYQVFCDLNGISRSFAEAFVAAEEEIELALCIALPAIQQIAQDSAGEGKRVIFVSDTYHTSDFLLQLLRHVGYDVQPRDIFVSSLTRKSKQSGELFPYILAAIGTSPKRVLHLGDHPISDYSKALSAGMNAILHPHKAAREASNLLPLADAQVTNTGDPSLSQIAVLRGMRQLTNQVAKDRGHRDDFWWKFGYRAAGPLTVGFCQWLEQGLRAEGMEHAFFLMRDGELFFQVYQALFGSKPGACPGTRLDSSRRAMLLPVLEFFPLFAIPSLFAGIGPRPVREYLDRLGVSAELYQQEAIAAGFHSLEERIDGRTETKRLMQLFVQPRVLQALLAKSKQEREALTQYLIQQGMPNHSKVAIVDLGWTGTIHKSLHLLLNRTAPETHLTGFYVATFPDAENTIIPKLERRSYLAHAGNPLDVFLKINSFLNLFESVYSSTEGSTLYFAPDAANPGRVHAVRQVPDKSPEQCSQLDAIHAAVLAFANDYRRVTDAFDFPALPPELASEEFFRVIDRPTCEEALRLGGLTHCDNLGSTSKHVSATLRPNADLADLLEDLSNANWKKGVLTLPTPEAAALRTLLWLMDSEPC